MNAILAGSIILIALLSVLPSVRFGTNLKSSSEESCQQQVDGVLALPAWQEQLRSPDLQDPAGLKLNYQRYLNIINCVNDHLVATTPDVETLVADIQLYLVFIWRWQAPKIDEGNLTLVHLKTVTNPAIEKLRAVNIQLMGDDYVLIWRYRSKDYLPAVLQDYFKGDVAGITFGKHYVAYIDISPSASDELRKDVEQKAQATLSHELVHAYVNQSVADANASMPHWYAEGLAVYFSGSGEPLIRISRDQSQVYSYFPSDDYAQYRDNFLYLENLYGKATFTTLIRQSIAASDPNLLLRQGGIRSEEDLTARANTWLKDRRLTRLGLGLAGVFGLFILGWSVVKLTRTESMASIRRALGYVESEYDVMLLEERGRVGPLIRALAYQNKADPLLAVRIRQRAGQALGQYGGATVVKAFIGALSDPDSTLRELAAQSLGRLGNIESVDPLLQAVSTGQIKWASAALQAIGDRQAVLPLIRQVWLQPNRTNQPVVDALVMWHARANLIPEMMAALQSPEPALRAGAAYLGGCCKILSLRHAVYRLMNDPAEIVQAAALRGASRMESDEARRRLVSLLSNSEAAAQEKILRALSYEWNALVRQVLYEAFSSLQSDAGRWAAIDILKTTDREKAISILAELLESSGRPDIQARAVDDLLYMGDPCAIPYLLRALFEKEPPSLSERTWERIGQLLGALGDRELLSQFVTYLYVPDEKKCLAAAIALNRLYERGILLAEDMECLQPHFERINGQLKGRERDIHERRAFSE